jgi:glutamate/tyrosine decarboxylase-like PLP-dependent enzyme
MVQKGLSATSDNVGAMKEAWAEAVADQTVMLMFLHANADLRRTRYFASANWPGCAMLNSTTQSTRSGGPLAAAWTVLRHIGAAGYRDLADRTFNAVRRIRAGIEEIDGLRVLGDPDATLPAVAAHRDDFDVFTVADEMKRGTGTCSRSSPSGPRPRTSTSPSPRRTRA